MLRRAQGNTTRTGRMWGARAACVFAAALAPAASLASEGPAKPLGELLPVWSVVPFVGILLSIALFPLFAPHFWHRHYPKVSLGWAVLFLGPALWAYGSEALHAFVHILLMDYLPFIILLWGLFAVSGGVVVKGRLAGTPTVNTAFLAVGTAIASWTGTTGAAMLLIRPLLRANAGRRHRAHTVVFFIFLVANIGGSLTPLGDPPLFLGFLQGVPFFWTFRLFPEMALASAVLLTAYFFLDRRYFRREPPQEPVVAGGAPLRVEGLLNLVFLGGIVGAVLLSGFWKAGAFEVAGLHVEVQNLVRDALILCAGGLSLRLTPRELRLENGFSWEPMREVAILFAGIFVTILPALAILKAGGAGHFAPLIAAVREPWQYFWVAGGLSSFLDNAPTYLTFFYMQLGRFYPGVPQAEAVPQLLAEHAVYLKAVAVGAVFMGANTYIGNAPNFMVRAIAEEAGVAMPSFFGYLFKWSVPILIPLFLVIGILFF